MIIKKIEQGKFKKEYLTLYFEEDSPLRLHKEVAARHNLAEGMDLDAKVLQDIRAEGEKKEASEYALSLLSYRALTEREMTDRLRRKGYGVHVANLVVHDFKERGLLNDSEYARGFAESRMKRKLVGDEKIRQDLARKGVPKEEIRQAFEKVKEENPEGLMTEDDRAFEVASKRRKQMRETDWRTIYRQLYGYLARRGFAPDTVERALRRLKTEQQATGEEE